MSVGGGHIDATPYMRTHATNAAHNSRRKREIYLHGTIKMVPASCVDVVVVVVVCMYVSVLVSTLLRDKHRNRVIRKRLLLSNMRQYRQYDYDTSKLQLFQGLTDWHHVS